MSVINETLENLKHSKKKSSGVFNPSSSAYCEKVIKAEKEWGSKRSYMISASFAVLVGALFYFAHTFSSSDRNTSSEAPSTAKHWFSSSHFEANRVSAPKTTYKPTVGIDVVAQKMYYDALTSLNEGNEEQALQRLSDIMRKYPDFEPAKQAYHTLNAN